MLPALLDNTAKLKYEEEYGMKKRTISLVLCMAVILSLLVGCATNTPSNTDNTQGNEATNNSQSENQTSDPGTSSAEPIEIAVITTSLTGSLATNGEYIMNGVNMALE